MREVKGTEVLVLRVRVARVHEDHAADPDLLEDRELELEVRQELLVPALEERERVRIRIVLTNAAVVPRRDPQRSFTVEQRYGVA